MNKTGEARQDPADVATSQRPVAPNRYRGDEAVSDSAEPTTVRADGVATPPGPAQGRLSATEKGEPVELGALLSAIWRGETTAQDHHDLVIEVVGSPQNGEGTDRLPRG
jgi:hypothetical protein